MIFEEEVAQSKQEYLEKVLNEASRYEHLYIYGAGNAAIPLVSMLQKIGISVEAFCVTEKSKNKKQECGLPIIQLDEVIYPKETCLFLLGVQAKFNEEIIKELQQHGFSSYIPAPQLLYYYGKKMYDFVTRPVLEITTRIGCSINCRYCPQKLLVSEYTKDKMADIEMGLDTFKKCIDKTPQNLIVEFAGFSEPFLNPKCFDMMEYARRKGHEVNLYTTLVGLKESDMKKLQKIEFARVVLHVPDKMEYANIPMNDKYLALLDKVLDEKKKDGNPLVDWISSQSEPKEEILDVVSGRGRIFAALYDRAGNLEGEALVSKKNIQGVIRCEGTPNLNHNILLPDGRVVLCPEDYGLKHVIGNLLTDSYEKLFESNEMKRITACMHGKEDGKIICRNCVHAITVN